MQGNHGWQGTIGVSLSPQKNDIYDAGKEFLPFLASEIIFRSRKSIPEPAAMRRSNSRQTL